MSGLAQVCNTLPKVGLDNGAPAEGLLHALTKTTCKLKLLMPSDTNGD